jgi:hypothetical protein
VRANSPGREATRTSPYPSAEHREAFLARLRRMSPQERARASRFEFDRWERSVWAGHYPDEVPTINGEVEWIALGLADLD